MTRIASTVLALALSFGMASAVSAQERVGGNVMIVHALEAPGEIAPELAQLPGLRRPPFSAFRTMSVLSRNDISLQQGQDRDIRLPNGRTLRIQLQRVMPDGRYRVRVSIDRPGQSAYLPLLQVAASPGQPFFVVGQAHEGGTLLIGITLNAT